MDLKERKGQAVIINAITEINNMLEGNNSRITETEKELIRWWQEGGNR